MLFSRPASPSPGDGQGAATEVTRGSDEQAKGEAACQGGAQDDARFVESEAVANLHDVGWPTKEEVEKE